MKTTGSFGRTLFATLGCIAAVVTAHAQSAPSPLGPVGQPGQKPGAGAPRAADEVIELNPFEVSAVKDNSYGALNSNSLTSFKTELDKVPVSADVFSKTFMDDIGATNVEDMIQGFTSGAGTTTSNPAGTAATSQPGDRNGGTAISLRGLSSGTTLRNGHFPVTSNGVGFTTNFDLERVEVVSGPQSLLYGAGGGGGVVNYTSKQAKFNSAPRAEISAQMDQYSHKLGTLDYGVGSNRMALRLALMNQQVGSRRDFIGGNFVGGFVQLAAKPFRNTVVRLDYEKTSYTRILNNNFTVTGLSTADDARNGQRLHYLLATNQIDSAANGAPSGAGRIVNGNINWNNIDSFGGAMLAEIRRLSFVTAQVETTWTRWLSTKIATGYSDLDSWKIGNSGVNLLAPNAAANPTYKPAVPATPTSPAIPAVPGEWMAGMLSSQTTATDLWQPSRVKNLRASAVVTNDLFKGRARSQTVVGGDFSRYDTGGGGVGLYYVQADKDFNPVIAARNPTTGLLPNNGYTNLPVQYWSVANGPVKYPLWGGFKPEHLTIAGQNYVLSTTNAPVPGKVDPVNNPLGLSGDGSGSYRPNRKVEKGVYFANYTTWFEDRLTTLFGARANVVNLLGYSENSGSNKAVIPSTVSVTEGTGLDYSMGATFRLLPMLRAYVGLSDSYAPPSGTAQDPYGNSQKSSKTVGQEVGLKVTNQSGTLSGSIAYFRANAKNELISFDVSLVGMINPSGLNGRVGIAPSNALAVDRNAEGVHVNLTANPTRNWRMRFAAGWQQAVINSGGSYAQLYNDEFNANSQGQVTYKDGTVVYVDPTTTKATVTATGAAGAVPLTITMMSTPPVTGAPNPYYANPAANNAQINATSGAAVILQGLSSYYPAGSVNGIADPNITAHGPILTGRIGLPISNLQIKVPPTINSPPGIVPIARSGERSQGSPQLTFNYTSVYSFEHGLLKGVKIGGTFQAAWKRGAFYYYPNGIAKDPTNRALFQWPTQCLFNGILGYEWKWRKTRVSTQVNVNNMFNRYHIVIIPNLTAGYAGVCDATFDAQPRSYVWSMRIDY